MSDRDGFENIYAVPEGSHFDSAKNIYVPNDPSENPWAEISAHNRNWMVWQKAVEHCKQGEPVATVYREHLGGSKYGLHAHIHSECNLKAGDVLFAHAMPKSEGKPYGYVIDPGTGSSCSFRKESPDDYNLALIASRGGQVTAVYTTPQPSTDVSELDQPRLTVRLVSFPESNGKRNWTAQIVRVGGFDGLVGTGGGITIAHGELWNRVAYEAERTKYLLGERDIEPHILDYGDDIKTPEEWAGEVHRQAHREMI